MTRTAMAGAGTLAVQLAADIDRALLARVYAVTGRVHIPGIFEERAAVALHQALRTETAWSNAYEREGRTVEVPVENWRTLTPADRERIGAEINGQATRGAQHFRLIRKPDGRQPEAPIFKAAHRFLASPVFAAFMRGVTGARKLTLATSEFAIYGPGHFRTAEPNASVGSDEIGFIFNFAPRWRTDWGGLLYFYEPNGHVAEGYAPVFNALDVFSHPRQTSLTIVTPFADGARFCLAGTMKME